MESAAAQSPGQPGPRWARADVALALPALLCVGLAARGYGNDGDTYAMLAAWRSLVDTHAYVMSRPPGYPLPELLVGTAAYLGGFPLANLLTAAFGLLALACLLRLLRPLLGAGLAAALVLWVGVNPYWVIAASSSMDYMYSLGFALAGLCLLASRRPKTAALLFVCSAASRLTIAPVLGLALLVAGLRAGRWRTTAASTALFVGGTLACYAPSWASAGRGMFAVVNGGHAASFFTFDTGSFTFWGVAARTVYKNLMLLGAVPLAALVVVLLRARRGAPPRLDRPLVAAAAIALVYFEVLFLRLPHEPAYLLPALPLVALLAGSFRPPVRAVGALVVLSLLNGLVTLDPIELEYASKSPARVEATSGRFAPHFATGVLVEDARDRPATQVYFLRARGIHGGNTLRGVFADTQPR